MTPLEMKHDLNIGTVFRKPVVIKEHGFHDFSDFSTSLLMKRLCHTFKEVEVQGTKTIDTKMRTTKGIARRWRRISKSQSRDCFDWYNLLNLRAIGDAAQPAFIQQPRMQVLKELLGRISGDVGKPTTSDNVTASSDTLPSTPIDVESCLHFGIFGMTGSFSGPHLDILSGTWVRCLDGVKAWIVATDLQRKDYEEFADVQPLTWCPHERTKIIILEQGDVLFLPPGADIIHAPVTLETCWMEGGMVWDRFNLSRTLESVRWITQRPFVTNETVPEQLRTVLEALMEVVKKGPISKLAERIPAELYCSCDASKCRTVHCPCLLRDADCNARWCKGHANKPTLGCLPAPPQRTHEASDDESSRWSESESDNDCWTTYK